MGDSAPVVVLIDAPDNPDARGDDKLLAAGNAVREMRGEATFLLSGGRARQLRQRGRRDVVDLLSSLDIGYSGDNTGSIPAKHLDGLEWEKGVAAFSEKETAGYEELAFLAGRIPSCFHARGWAPQIYGVLSEWGTRAVVSSDRFLKSDGRPFFFGGRLNLIGLGSNWIDLDVKSLTEDEATAARVARQVESATKQSSAVVLTVRPDDWRDRVEAATKGFQKLLTTVRAIDADAICSCRQAANRLADISYEYTIAIETLRKMAASAASGQLAPFEHEPGFLCPAEQLYLLASAWNDSNRKGKPVRNSTSRSPLGPPTPAATTSKAGISAEMLPGVIKNVVSQLTTANQLPATVPVGDGVVAVKDLLPTLAAGFVQGIEARDLPIRRGSIAEVDRVDVEALTGMRRRLGLTDPVSDRLALEHVRQQMWTYKPMPRAS